MTEQPAPPSASSSGILFLSGAGLQQWIWDGVRAELPETPAEVADYPRGTGASLAEYADAAAAQVTWPTFAVVAHSVGGVVATELLARHPGRVTAVLGIAAVVPRPGRSFVRSMPFPARLVLGPVLRVAGTRPPAGSIRTGLAAGLPEPTAERIGDEFEPESLRLYLDRTSVRDLPPVRGYLHTDRDEELRAAAQRDSADVLRATWTEHLPTGHLPMLEEPVQVARAVRRLLRPPAG